jgi:hypothetical protein
MFCHSIHESKILQKQFSVSYCVSTKNADNSFWIHNLYRRMPWVPDDTSEHDNPCAVAGAALMK